MSPTQLQTLRAKLKLSQVELAKVLKVAPNTVARWEQGVHPIAPAMAQLLKLIARQGKG